MRPRNVRDWAVLSAIVVSLTLIACTKKPNGSGSATLSAVYQQTSPPRTCITSCGSDDRWGVVTVHNSGGSDAINVRVHIKTECEDYYNIVIPSSLAPGQYGSAQTGAFYGCTGPTVSAISD